LDSGGNEFYNALEVEVRKKYGRNLTMDAAWTWAKDLTDTEDDGGGGGVVTGQTLQNQFNRAIEKSNNINVAPNRFYAYWTYILPVGEGQPLLPKAHGPLQQVLGGWRTTWSVVTQSGQWFTPSFSGYDPSNTGVFGGIPDRVPGVAFYPANRTVNDWFNANAFAIPGCPNSTPVCTNPANVGRFGTSGENILSGPSLFSLDFGLFKYFSLSEHVRLQFIMTMANAFNHPNYATPASNISSTGTVGISSSEVTPQEVEPAPREIDFGLRLTF
jgi:hypothetical protein